MLSNDPRNSDRGTDLGRNPLAARSIPTAPVIGSVIPSQRQRRAPITPESLEGKDLAHTWLVAATMEVDDATAKHAAFRLSFKVKVEDRVDALEVYCGGCRRPYYDVALDPCAAKINNEHLIGGDQRERAKRKAPAPLGAGQTIIPGPRVNRRGIEAVVGKQV